MEISNKENFSKNFYKDFFYKKISIRIFSIKKFQKFQNKQEFKKSIQNINF